MNRHSAPKARRKPNQDFIDWYGTKGLTGELDTYLNTTLDCRSAYAGFKKYNKPDVASHLNEEQEDCFQLAIKFCWEEFHPYMTGKLLSDEDVYNMTDQSKSPGFPWNQKYRTTDEFYNSIDSDYLRVYWDAAKSNAFCIWNSFDKEELRKREKVKQKQNRQINGCPAEFKYAMNRYTVWQNENFYKGHLKTASAVGLDAFHGGWEQLFWKLRGRFENGYSADIKAMDSDFQARLLEAVRDIRWACMEPAVRKSEEHRTRFFKLYDEVIRSHVIMPWGEVMQKHLGNPSGNTGTVVDNTLGCYMLFAYCYIREFRKKEGRNPTRLDYKEMVEPQLYGDDNTWSSSPEGLKMLNPATISAYSKEIGWTVTFDEEEPRRVMDLDFLSKKFRIVKYQGRHRVVFCPLDPLKAFGSIAWRDKGDLLNTWAHVCGIRLTYFFEPTAINIIEEYALRLRRIIDKAYPGYCIEWVRAQKQYLPDSEVWDLYLG